MLWPSTNTASFRSLSCKEKIDIRTLSYQPEIRCDKKVFFPVCLGRTRKTDDDNLSRRLCIDSSEWIPFVGRKRKLQYWIDYFWRWKNIYDSISWRGASCKF
jgi:hypothetical protein